MSKPKVLFLDIEATNLSASMGYILCIGYKWAHKKKPGVIRIDRTKEFRKKKTDDSGVLKKFEKIFNEADLVVHHFGDYYDIPFIQTRRIIKGMKPMDRVATVDTWRIAKKRLKFHSNRLAAIIEALGCPIKKTSLKGGIWIDAMAGDRKAIDYVVDHCEKDVLSLEWVYNTIKVIWDQHPAIYGSEKCNSCGGKEFRSNGIRPTIKRKYRRLVCVKCGLPRKGEVL